MFILDDEIPHAIEAVFQHAVDTYASETNKVIATWQEFDCADLQYRPHPKSSTVLEILRHELLSQRRFFGEFLSHPEPPAESILPEAETVKEYCGRLRQLSIRRLAFLASRSQDWWLEPAPFFGERRQRIWIFWRRILHTAHHRTQLTVYLRTLDKPVPAIYGPSADRTWDGADPTNTVAAASRN